MNIYDRYKGKIPLEDLKGLMNAEPVLTLRVNTLKTTKEDLLARLTKKGFRLGVTDVYENALIVLKEPFSVGATTEYLSGEYMLQDAASMICVNELAIKPHERVLDMAAAPGAKTTHISELLKNTGVVIACDPNKKRLKSVMYNTERLGVTNVIGLNIKAQELVRTGMTFDKILLDAPCSAEGTLHKNPEVLEKQTNYKTIISEQLSLIEAGLKMLNKGGILVYSTCAINPDENEGVVKHALSQGAKLVDLLTTKGAPGINLDKARRFYPHKDGTSGFFIARLMK